MADYLCDKCNFHSDDKASFVYHHCPKKDAIHPEHYSKGGIQPFDVMRAKMTSEQFEGFLLGNVLKYTMRYNMKNGLEDLKKAQNYLNILIDEKEKPSN